MMLRLGLVSNMDSAVCILVFASGGATEDEEMRRLFCRLFGHDYRVWQHFSRTSRRVICSRCDGDWGMNDHVRAFIPWSGELAEIYEMQGHKIKDRLPDRVLAAKGE